MKLFHSLSRHLDSGALEELTLTTNGSQLSRFAHELAGLGVKRVNVSLDTLNPDKFQAITRWGKFDKVMRSEEHTSELQSLMRISYAVFCLKKKKKSTVTHTATTYN